ncbi:MAG TPA: gamma-glutamyltransferase [Candidatus Dormibacteraeota bacterium]
MTAGVVASPHRLASEAGARILKDGGNAIDAAIAANAVLCVVYPHMTSIGGDLMAIVWPAGAQSPVGLVGAGRAGELASIAAVRERGYEEMPLRGALPVTVPGTVEAWGRLLERFGTFGLGAVLEPAVAAAHDGYVITPQLSANLMVASEFLAREPEAYALYPPMEAGMLLRNPQLATVLRDIGRRGIGGFYRGDLAAAIAKTIQRRDGFVTAKDLANHHSQWVEPVAFAYRGVTIYELPPPTQGLAAAAMLVRLGALRVDELQPGPAFIAPFRKARDESYALRDRYITDPEFAAIPAGEFLTPGRTVAPRGSIRDAGDTVYLCAADEHGNVVSLIQSLAFDFGSGVVAEGTGVLLHDRGCYFSLDPAHVNRLEAKKRTMHTLIPAMAARDGRPWAAFGTMGGDGQPQLQAQVLMNLVDGGLAPDEAVARPRIRILAGGEKTSIEADYPGAGGLARSDASIHLMPAKHHQFGHAQALVIDGPRAWRAGADPRSDGSVEFAG